VGSGGQAGAEEGGGGGGDEAERRDEVGCGGERDSRRPSTSESAGREIKRFDAEK